MCRPKVQPMSHIYTPRVLKNAREWAHTLPSGLPLWELKFLRSFECSKSNLKGQNSLDWRVSYTIEILLKSRCLKWTYMTHLSTLNTSYGQMKGQESKCQFDSWPLKVGNHPDVLVCMWHATYHWKSLGKGYNFALDLTSIGGLHKKLQASRVLGVPISKISDSQFGSSKTKWHLGQQPWLVIENTIKGKVVVSPKSGLWWVLWVHVCLCLICAPKVIQLCTNQLVFWFA
jgi:hypothetical protein